LRILRCAWMHKWCGRQDAGSTRLRHLHVPVQRSEAAIQKCSEKQRAGLLPATAFGLAAKGLNARNDSGWRLFRASPSLQPAGLDRSWRGQAGFSTAARLRGAAPRCFVRSLRDSARCAISAFASLGRPQGGLLQGCFKAPLWERASRAKHSRDCSPAGRLPQNHWLL